MAKISVGVEDMEEIMALAIVAVLIGGHSDGDDVYAFIIASSCTIRSLTVI